MNLLHALGHAFARPLIAVAASTCSVGNVLLAAVLWNDGISFGGVASFIFGDLVILPILDIYRQYYGTRTAVRLAAVFYAAMVAAALVVEMAFRLTGWVPRQRHAEVVGVAIRFDYTGALDIVMGAVSVLMVTLFLRTGSPAMMRQMSDAAHGPAHPH